MFVNPEIDREIRKKQITRDIEKERREHEETKKNSRFTQVSPKGWERVRELLMDK